MLLLIQSLAPLRYIIFCTVALSLIMKTASKPWINLLRGHPHPDLLPALQFRKASELAFSNPSVLYQGLNYGPDQGYEPLRSQLARWLTQFYQPNDPVGPERICISAGASQNLARILQVFSDPIYHTPTCGWSPQHIFLPAGYSKTVPSTKCARYRKMKRASILGF